MDKMGRFDGRTVLITGASKGIGRGIAEKFAGEGAKLFLVARNEEPLKELQSSLLNNGSGTKEVAVCPCDVSSSQSVQKMFKIYTETFGESLDVLVHNAGVFPTVLLEDMTEEQWDEVIDINLKGSYLVCKAALPFIKKSQNQKRIVLTSSITGNITGMPGFSHYGASKAGQNGFMKSLALELTKYQITVNAVMPGNIATDAVTQLGQEYIDDARKSIPMDRLGTPSDIANAVSFLASEESAFITGQGLVVDGGQTLPEMNWGETA